MPHIFDDAVTAAVLHHMNDDHTDDNLLIARAFLPATDGGGADAGGAGAAATDADVTDAVMTGFDGDGGTWQVTRGGETTELVVPWPGGPITERPEVRREIVALYDAACARLGVEPRPHA